MTSPMIWLNDCLVPADQARIDPTDRGFLLADGLFETMRVAQGKVRHLSLHLRRLEAGCAVLDLPVPQHLPEALSALLAANSMTQGSARLTWTRGTGPRGLLPSGLEQPTLLITTTPAAHAASAAGSVKPWALVTSMITRRNEFSPLSRIKSLNYGDGLLARQEAARLGAQDAILLNTQGRVAETTIASLFVYREGIWLTPPVAEGALPGIRRARALEEGLAEESILTREDILFAEAAVLTSSLMIQEVGQIDSRALPQPKAARAWKDRLSAIDCPQT